MKRTTSVLFFLVLMLFVASCTKEIEELSRDFEDQAEKIAATDQVDTSAKEDVYYPVEFTAVLDDTLKTVLNIDGNIIEWCSGDSIAIMQYGRYKRHDNPEVKDGYDELYQRDASCNKFVATGSGKEVAFTGSIKNFTFRDTSADIEPDDAAGNSQANILAAVYPYVNSGYYMASTSYDHTVPSVQTGKLSDFGKYAVTYASVGEADIDTVGGKLSFELAFKCPLPIVKLTIPSGMDDIDTVFVSAAKGDDGSVVVPVAGKVRFRLSGTKSNFKVLEKVNSITIARRGECVTGDVYVFVMPDSIRTTNWHKNTATRLRFDFKRKTGAVASFSGNIVNKATANKFKASELRGGRLKILGTVNPSKLTFSDVVLCSEPTEIRHKSMSVSNGQAFATESAISGCTFTKINSEDNIGDYTYGVEFSADGGASWTATTSTNGTQVGETDVVSFTATVEKDIPMAMDVLIRTFAYKTSDKTTRGHSANHFALNKLDADRFVMVKGSSNPFVEELQTAATESYSNKIFYTKNPYYPIIANGTLYRGDKGFYFSKNRSMSLPVIPGTKISVVLPYMRNTDPRSFGILQEGASIPFSTESFTCLLNSSKDDAGYYQLNVPESSRKEMNVVSTTYASTIITAMVIGYKYSSDYKGSVTSLGVDYLNGKTRFSYNIVDGNPSDFTRTFQYFDGSNWNDANPVSTLTVGTSHYEYIDNPANYDKFRVSIRRNGALDAYTQVAEVNKPDKQILIDFTDTNPFEQDGTEESGSGTIDDPYLGKPFSFGENLSTSGNYTSYKLKGTDYKFIFGRYGTSSSHKYGWIFHPDGEARLKTSKLRMKIPAIGDGYVLKSAYAYSEGNTKSYFLRLNSIYISGSKTMNAAGLYWYFTTTTETDWFCYGSNDNDESTQILVLNYYQ